MIDTPATTTPATTPGESTSSESTPGAVRGCAGCRSLTSAPANVHPAHITHHDAGHHLVRCPDTYCEHYPEAER